MYASHDYSNMGPIFTSIHVRDFDTQTTGQHGFLQQGCIQSAGSHVGGNTAGESHGGMSKVGWPPAWYEPAMDLRTWNERKTSDVRTCCARSTLAYRERCSTLATTARGSRIFPETSQGHRNMGLIFTLIDVRSFDTSTTEQRGCLQQG